MKKLTIAMFPEYEWPVLECIGKTGVTHLIEVKGTEFEHLAKSGKRELNYSELSKKFDALSQKYSEYNKSNELPKQELSISDLKRFTNEPESILNELTTELEQSEANLKDAKIKLEQHTASLEDAKIKKGLESLFDLKTSELEKCLAIGIVQSTILPSIETHLKRKEGIIYRIASKSPTETFILVNGSESAKIWTDTVFHLFEVKPIEYLAEKDLEKLENEVKKHESSVKELEDKYLSLLGKATYIGIMVKNLFGSQIPILRTKELSVIQGWVPDDQLSSLKQEIDNLNEKTGNQLLIQFEEHTADEELPVKLTVQPNFFNPAITLTKLRGWPSAHEINPTLITILVFSLQFGVMFGDVGQGLIFLLLGFILPRKFKAGLAQKLGVMFVPMGIFAIIFGFLYGEMFLIEGVLHPLFISPLHSIGTLMKTVLGFGVLEMSFGLVLGAINQYKAGNIFGVLGEHGLGGILFLVGLYNGGLYFLQVGDFFAVMSHWTFYVILSGLILSFIDPLLGALKKHEKINFEVIGEGFAAFLMTFVENLSNFFSFLRIAAFALAHACLAVAAHALMGTMGPASIVLMNIIAMSFEFVSSCVQSLRLLYYEFMSKFFHGGGIPYKPFMLREK
jgi:V/A-type H+-transporting ATPase subunit I